MVEVKCPAKRKIESKEYYDELEAVVLKFDDGRKLRRPLHCATVGYWWQMQLQMEVADLDWCYFVQFKPGDAWHGETLVINEVPRDREIFAQALVQLRTLWDEIRTSREANPDWAKPPAEDPTPPDTGIVSVQSARRPTRLIPPPDYDREISRKRRRVEE